MTLGPCNYVQVEYVGSSNVQRSVLQLLDVQHLQQKRRHLHLTTTESAPSDLLTLSTPLLRLAMLARGQATKAGLLCPLKGVPH